MPGNRDIVRRVRKYHFGFVRAEKSLVAALIQGIAAEQRMLAYAPTITQARDCRHRTVNFRNFVRIVGGVVVEFIDEKIDFRSFKTGDRDIEIQFDRKLLEFEREQFSIPSGILGESIVCNDIRADLC